MSVSSIRFISSDWQFTQIGGGEGTKDGEWLPTSRFPTTVHVELLNLGRIPDPFIGLSEWEVQWIGESEWAFRTIFTISKEETSATNIDLVFEGLDTFAVIKLNGCTILETQNQFVSYRTPVKQSLVIGSNELVLNFKSAFLEGKDIEMKQGRRVLSNGDPSRLYVRKAQYNYGWDWGPILMTVGPWKPIYLHTYKTRISDFDIRSQVSQCLDVNLVIDITLSDKSPALASLTLKDHRGFKRLNTGLIPMYNGRFRKEFYFPAGVLELWYPLRLLDSRKQNASFRRARVIQENLVDQPGLSFVFEINNIRIFCGGSNWIPADSFLTNMTRERYRGWLKLLVDGNQNMIRVWGGGIYEAEDFYDICDESGILVWQDFMFSCGQYPADDLFLRSVRQEAEQNVKRLRNHPSVVIFAGNNEDYQLAEQLGLELDYADEKSDYRSTNFPARYIYERLLPEIVGSLSDIYYHRGSPYSGHGKPTVDQTLGDLHQWNVWHGSQEPWSNWDILAGRFVSEFGMEGFPNIRTVDYWLSGHEDERFPQSRTNCNHNKAGGSERRLELYLVENFRHSFEMESYVYYTQIMQAEALASAFRLWRRNWRGQGKEYTAGALVWQLNDCWPVTSWAIVDYFLRPKPAYFAISRELRPITVGMIRQEKKTFANERTAAYFTIETELEIWAANSTLVRKNVTLEVTSFDLHTSWVAKWSTAAELAENASTELYKGPLPGQPRRRKVSDIPKDIVVSARLLDDAGVVLARHCNWAEPFKFIKFPPTSELGLNITVCPDGSSVKLSARKPIKGLVLEVEGPEVRWSDQALDLVPDDPLLVRSEGLNGREVKARHLGDGRS